MGRKGSWVAAFMERVGKASPDEKRELGRQANELKREAEQLLGEREAAMVASARPAGGVDITLPGRAPVLGYRHPLSLVREQVQEIFTRLDIKSSRARRSRTTTTTSKRSTCRRITPRATCRTRCISPTRSRRGDPDEDAVSRGKRPNTPQPLTLLRTHTSAMQIRHMERHDRRCGWSPSAGSTVATTSI